MNLSGIPEIRVETNGDEATYWLPVRPLGAIRWLGLLPIGFSVLWFSGVSHILQAVCRQFLDGKQHAVDYVFMVFVLGIALAGCIPAGFGLLIMFGRCRVRWRNGRLTVSETVGLFGWPRRLPRKAIRKFTLKTGVSRNGQPVTTGAMAAMATLVAEFDGAAPRIVANGYPRNWMEALAADLSARAARSQPAPPAVEMRDLNSQPSELSPWSCQLETPQSQAAPEQPADSKVVIQHQSASVVLEIPPAGLRKGSMGLFFFACLWCLLMLVFTVVAVFGKRGNPAAGSAPLWPFLVGFWAVGLGMMAGAVNLGRRRATLTGGKSGLIVLQTGPFGVKRREFRRDQIAAIRTGPSNVLVNNSPVPELQIHSTTGKKVGMFVGRDAGELQWMAAELMNALGMAAQSQPMTSKQVPGTKTPSMPQPSLKVAGRIGFILIMTIAAVAFWFFGGGHIRPANRPAPATTLNKPSRPGIPGPVIPGLAFSSFSPSNTYKANTWAAGTSAHAEWFVSLASGPLAAVRIALEPTPRIRQPGSATVFIAQDEGGFPGAILESFSVPAMKPAAGDASAPLFLESVAEPELKAGVKYWVCARSTGQWQWHFNDQNIFHNAARELEPGKWVSAGDNCTVAAFSVTVSAKR